MHRWHVSKTDVVMSVISGLLELGAVVWFLRRRYSA
jgi:hypothetical protein